MVLRSFCGWCFKMAHKAMVCDKCKRSFGFSESNLCESGVQINGEDLMLVYFTCPFCKELYFISLKDSKSYELAEELRRAQRKIKNLSGKVNEERMRNYVDSAYRKQRRLEVHLRKLRKKYPGTFTVQRGDDGADTIVYVP